MSLNKTPGKTSIKDVNSGDIASVGTKADGTTKALEVIAEVSNGDEDLQVSFPESFVDPFSNFKVSNKNNIFDYTFKYDRSTEDYWATKSENGGSGSINTTTVNYVLNATTTASSRHVLQSRRYIEYNPGEAQEINISANFKGAVAGFDKCLGQYNDDNGVFFILQGTTAAVCIRTKTSGSVVDTVITQPNWNKDKLDGTGDSGITIDFDKQHLFYIDYSWLGTNIVRFGVVIDGALIICHQQNHANVLELPYMQSATLPLRAEIKTTGSPGAAETMQITCVSVGYRGNRVDFGRTRALDYAIPNSKTVDDDEERAVAGFRIDTAYPNVSALPIDWSVVPRSGSQEFIWRIRFNPTFVDSPTWADVNDSFLERLTNEPEVSDGTIVQEGYGTLARTGEDGGRVIQNTLIKSDVFAGRDVDNVADIFVLTIQLESSSGSVLATMNVREYQ